MEKGWSFTLEKYGLTALTASAKSWSQTIWTQPRRRRRARSTSPLTGLFPARTFLTFTGQDSKLSFSTATGSSTWDCPIVKHAAKKPWTSPTTCRCPPPMSSGSSRGTTIMATFPSAP